MRIISGTAKGRRLHSPRGQDKTRPLPDRVRTAIFNMPVGHLDGHRVLDAFAGTGAFGLECLSRGAEWCVLVERDREIARVLKRNIEDLGFGDQCQVIQGDALAPSSLARAPRPLHVVMFDPPYPMMKEQAGRERVFGQFSRAVGLLDAEGFGLLRTPWPFVDYVGEEGNRRKLALSLDVPGAAGPETHVYGSTAVHWYMRERQDSGEGAGA